MAARPLPSPAGGLLDAGARAVSVPAHQRIITAEEVFDLDRVNRDVVAVQCRQPSLEGTGIALCRIVKKPCGCDRTESSSTRPTRRRH